jgi:hypothetical protein
MRIMKLERKDLEARYRMFQYFALDDQRKYYKATSAKFRTSTSQVNRIRASLALFTGLSAAAAALIVQSSFVPGTACTVEAAPGHCGLLQQLTGMFTILSITLPAFAALFNTLADLYQWDRLITIYDSAQENIEIADAHSPDADIEEEVRYRAALMAYAEGTLSVMRDEASQWGQAIRTPVQLERYLEDAEKKVNRLRNTIPAGAGSEAALKPLPFDEDAPSPGEDSTPPEGT